MPGLHVSNVLIFQGNNSFGFQRQAFYQQHSHLLKRIEISCLQATIAQG